MRVGWRKSEKANKSLGFNPTAPKITLHGVFFWFFFKITVLPLHSQIQSIGLLLKFFDVPDSFLMLF